FLFYAIHSLSNCLQQKTSTYQPKKKKQQRAPNSMESKNYSIKADKVVLDEKNKESITTTTDRCYFSELPSHVTLEILLKLPIEALIRCRYVCKSWRDLLLDPSFAKLHHGIKPTGVMLQSSLFPHGNSGGLYLLEPQEEEPTSIIAKFNNFTYLESTLVNSCNGLICSCDIRMANPIYISNPITALHWLVKLPNGSVLIRSFDLENEQFRAIPLPSSRVYYAIILDCVGCPVIYNIAQESFRVLNPNGILLTHVKATAHASSFVSLKDIAMGDGSRVLMF
ncbi:putative f-box/kelch-repeat protein, partial [Quercus suber]